MALCAHVQAMAHRTDVIVGFVGILLVREVPVSNRCMLGPWATCPSWDDIPLKAPVPAVHLISLQCMHQLACVAHLVVLAARQ